MSANDTFSYTPSTGNALSVEVRDGKVIFSVATTGGRYGGKDANLAMVAEVPAREVFDLASLLETAAGNALYEEVVRDRQQ